jgi:hypothetical protein
MQSPTYANQVLIHNAAWTGLTVLDRAAAAIEAGLVQQGIDGLCEGLQDVCNQMLREDWTQFAGYAREQHHLRHVVYQDPMTMRAFEKPRGYAGDAVMMDYLYGIHDSHRVEAQASPLGREIFRCVQRFPASQAVRYRREHIAQLIDTMAAGGSKPSVLAIAAGHLREAEICEALVSGRAGRFVALDADATSLREVEANYARLNVETVHGSVRHVLARKLNLGTFDFVYAAGLYDYLADNVAQALAARMFEMVRPGGWMLIPNFAPQVRDRGYLETFMNWNLIYRDEYEMALLGDSLDPTHVEGYDVYSDPPGSVVYLLVKRSAK